MWHSWRVWDTVRRISGVDDSRRFRSVVPIVGPQESVQAAGLLSSRRKGALGVDPAVGDPTDLTSRRMAIAHRVGRSRRRLVGTAPSSGSRCWTC
ncbi:hypothetical protein [Pseudonocardia yunnanensis]|uniref:Uncharacterized protein n=1 Tax=Pseudonocardia yunnanensis TaxID=58107 RepID=A0ABW4EWW8_9PSEU